MSVVVARPTVSVVIPAYRASKWIPEALDSVIHQTYDDFEVLLVDQDCDEAMDRALAPFVDHIIRLTLRPPGVSAARNLAIRHARGEFIVNLDADDVWLPNAIERMVEALRSQSLDAVTPNAVFFGAPELAGRLYQDVLPPKGHPITYDDVLTRRTHIFSGTMYRRSLAEYVNLYNESLRFGEDLDLWLKMLRAGARFDYLEEVLTRYRCHPDSASAGRSLRDVLSVYDVQPRQTKGERKALRRIRRSVAVEFLTGRAKTVARSIPGFTSVVSTLKTWKADF